jgi:hypothetical protein
VVVSKIEIIATAALTLTLGWIAAYGRRKRIGEARFDSKTGKEIK